MNRPFFLVALRLASALRHSTDANRRLADALGLANSSNEQLLRLCKGWQSRSQALYLIADPSKRDSVLPLAAEIDA